MTKEHILDEISSYIFNTSNQSTGQKILDFELDYKYYYYDFLKLGIDLNIKDISWWEFDNLIEGILLTENTAIGKVLQYRTYKKPSKNMKQQEQEEHKFYINMKQKYSLKEVVKNGFQSMWNFVKTKAGEKNGK